MTLEIVRYRLHNQFLSQTDLSEPGQVVERLGAVQAQDYAGAKWALGQRLSVATTDAEIDKDFNEGKILRTHVMRPTWHFLTPADIRWMLALTAPRVHVANGYHYRALELDQAILKQSNAVLEKALRGGNQLTRTQLGTSFQKAGILAAGLRLGYFLMHAELEGLICSGARRGKQFTYALLEERAPQVPALEREEALAELVKRYFTTRGPATLHDFTWWSGLTMADAKAGIEMVKSRFVSEVVDGQTYWLDGSASPIQEKSPTAHLLPNYDEYFIGFKDRSAMGKAARLANVEANNPAFLAHIIIIDGQVVGGWRRTLRKDGVLVELNLITELTKAEDRALMAELEAYGKFLGLPVTLAR
jgi:hypothetical protein